MKTVSRGFRAAKIGAIAAALWTCLSAPALILLGKNNVEHNTTAPTGAFANSGFELQGFWGSFQGTPIGPHHFITAAHVGGFVRQTFIFQGVHYATVARSLDPVSDLAIWEVEQTFPVFASLYDGEDETGAEIVILGRGAIKGAPVEVEGALKGWKWGLWDQRLRWGRNIVTAVVNQIGQPPENPPHYLQANFDEEGSVDEAHLGVGDSGGGIFVQQDGQWRLAAINYGVTGPYNTEPIGDGFLAAIFDEGGLYQRTGGVWQPTVDLPIPQPGSLYATRVKARMEWIQSVLATRTLPTLLASSSVEGPYLAETPASVDPITKTIRISIGANNRFFELQSSSSLTITSVQLDGSTLVLRYE